MGGEGDQWVRTDRQAAKQMWKGQAGSGAAITQRAYEIICGWMQRLMPDNYGHYEGHISRAASSQARTGAGSRQSGVRYLPNWYIDYLAGKHFPMQATQVVVYLGLHLQYPLPTTQSQFPVALSGGVRVECAPHKIIMEGEATKNRNRNRNQNAKCTQIYCTKKKKP